MTAIKIKIQDGDFKSSKADDKKKEIKKKKTPVKKSPNKKVSIKSKKDVKEKNAVDNFMFSKKGFSISSPY